MVSIIFPVCEALDGFAACVHRPICPPVFEDLREILRQTGKIRGGLTEGEERQLEEWAKGEAEYGLDAMFYGSVSFPAVLCVFFRKLLTTNSHSGHDSATTPARASTRRSSRSTSMMEICFDQFSSLLRLEIFRYEHFIV